jgi:hypothetical protein
MSGRSYGSTEREIAPTPAFPAKTCIRGACWSNSLLDDCGCPLPVIAAGWRSGEPHWLDPLHRRHRIAGLTPSSRLSYPNWLVRRPQTSSGATGYRTGYLRIAAKTNCTMNKHLDSQFDSDPTLRSPGRSCFVMSGDVTKTLELPAKSSL